jgi:hypothetical protein
MKNKKKKKKEVNVTHLSIRFYKAIINWHGRKILFDFVSIAVGKYFLCIQQICIN